MSESTGLTTEEWSERLGQAARQTAVAILHLGRELLEAKAALPHGEWGRLFPKHQNPVSNPLPFSQSKANKLMAIASNPILNSYRGPNLPDSWKALAALNQVTPVILQEAIVTGNVHPDMSIKEAQALQQTLVLPPPAWSVEAAEQRFRRAINMEIDGATPAHAHEVAELLKRLTDELEHAINPDRRDAIADARRDLDIHDSDPGGYRIFEDEHATAMHPGSPAVIGGVKSTHAAWYRGLTIKADGLTPLTRFQIEKRLDDIAACRLPTKRTRRTHLALEWALMGVSCA